MVWVQISATQLWKQDTNRCLLWQVWCFVHLSNSSLAIIFSHFSTPTILNYHLVCTSISCVRFVIVLVFALWKSKSISDHDRSRFRGFHFLCMLAAFCLDFYAFKHYAIQPSHPTCILIADVPGVHFVSSSQPLWCQKCLVIVSICIHECEERIIIE